MGTAVADLDGAPEALAQHHQGGVEEINQYFRRPLAILVSDSDAAA